MKNNHETKNWLICDVRYAEYQKSAFHIFAHVIIIILLEEA